MSFPGDIDSLHSYTRSPHNNNYDRDRVLRKFAPFVMVRSGAARCLVFFGALGFVVPALASGFPPFASRDFAVVVRGGVVEELTTGEKSVLANDFDIEDDRLTVFLARGVDHGTLILRDDGTFRYQHDGGKSNRDTFKYRVFDGTRYSRDTEVRIDVQEIPNAPPVVTAPVPNQEAIEGAAFRLDLSANFTDPDAGDQLTFSVRGLPNSGSLRIDPQSGVLSGTPVSADVRDTPYSIDITASDLAGATARLSFELLILRDGRADMALNISLAANPVAVGETAIWNIEVENRGPGNLVDGQLTAGWTTSGPPLTLTAPSGCTISGNATRTPVMDCAVTDLAARTSLMLIVEGAQDGDGDNSLIGVFNSDDPVLDNNSDLASAQVVAQFSEGPTQVVSVASSGVGTGDLDGDGAIDIIASAAETIVYFNNGNRAVTTPGVSLGPDSGGSVVAIVEWNGDGSPDIAVGGLGGAAAEVFVNDGAGAFSSGGRLPNAGVGTVNDMKAGDLDGDGIAELVLTGSTGTAIVRRAGDGGFDVLPLSTGAGLDLALADLDQDGDLDFAVVMASDRTINLHFNDGGGSVFSSELLSYGSVGAVTASDLNGDGAIDLLLGIDGDDLSAPENRVLFQQGSGIFTPGGSFGASPVAAFVTGDLDLDGWPDIVAVNEAGVHQVYRGASGGGLALRPEQIVSAGMRHAALTDFNGDGSLDLILVGRDAGVLEIHANNGIGKLGLGDRIAPELQLVGEATINIPAGQEFIDPGATATDDIDGDISDRIEVSGAINPTAVGTQTISYSVADRAGNRVSATRTVIVGVNQGTGGGGGGASGPTFALCLLLCLIGVRGSQRLRRTAAGTLGATY